MLGSMVRGFSLFELLITLSILGILASVAYPIYTHAIIKTRRAEAKIALINLANRIEIYYLENNNSYAEASLSKLGSNEKTNRHLYHLSLSSTNNTYKLAATALFTDPECRRLLLNELGEKTSVGDSQSCW